METKLKFKGTPGPWGIADIDDGWKDCVSSRSANGNVIAVAENENREIAEADARLIAAAPELLEALQCIVDAIEGYDGKRRDIETFALIAQLDELSENAKTVIKKALEEQ